MTIEAPRDITIPEGHSATARLVLSRALGRLVTDLRGVARTSPSLASIVGQALKANPGALMSALRTPTVGGLIRCVRNGGVNSRLLDELTALLALELARTGSLGSPVRLSRMPERLVSLPGRFVLAIPPDCSVAIFENGQLRIERAVGVEAETVNLEKIEGSGPFHAIDRGIVLAMIDNNPLAMMEAHPEKEGNAVDLGGKTTSEWVTAIQRALGLIERYLPDLRAEIDLFIHQVIPAGWDAERHLSASYQETIGTIYMSLHPSLMTMTEAIIHEFSHNKLNALFEIDEVLENAWHPLYTSPVRPDPRPLHGVLLAVHAFLPVARRYERMIEAGAEEAESASFKARLAQIRGVNREGADVVLTNGRPTKVGAGLLDEIRRWDAHFMR